MDFALPQLKAVGWLSREHSYETGVVSPEVFIALCRLLAKPWTPWAFMGVHDCEFCRFTGGFSSDEACWADDKGHLLRTRITAKSQRELIVPGRGCLYIAPESIAHYVDSHGYCPPAEFQEALLACPDTDSQQYKLAFLANGGRQVLQKIKEMKPPG